LYIVYFKTYSVLVNHGLYGKLPYKPAAKAMRKGKFRVPRLEKPFNRF